MCDLIISLARQCRKAGQADRHAGVVVGTVCVFCVFCVKRESHIAQLETILHAGSNDTLPYKHHVIEHF